MWHNGVAMLMVVDSVEVLVGRLGQVVLHVEWPVCDFDIVGVSVSSYPYIYARGSGQFVRPVVTITSSSAKYQLQDNSISTIRKSCVLSLSEVTSLNCPNVESPSSVVPRFSVVLHMMKSLCTLEKQDQTPMPIASELPDLCTELSESKSLGRAGLGGLVATCP